MHGGREPPDINTRSQLIESAPARNIAVTVDARELDGVDAQPTRRANDC